jgi:hypothetical protein
MTHHFDSARPTLAHELIYRATRSQAAFLKRVNAAHDAHWQDVQQARKEVPVEAQARRMHLIHWADCHPKEIRRGLFEYVAKQAEEKAVFSVYRHVRVRNGRTGKVIRILTDGRCVVKVDCPLLYWEVYTQGELIVMAKAA